jgi:uncharacterized protein YerC
MPKPKIDRVKLSQMLKAGKSQKEVAQAFGVTEGAISKAKKELNIAVVKNVALENAHKVVSEHLDAVAQLRRINRDAFEILDLVMAWNRGDDKALQILEGQVRKVKIGRGKNAEEVTEYRFKDPREIALRAMGEIRSQLSLQLDILKTLSDMEEVRKFQEEVLQIIAKVSSDARNRIIQRLKERGSLRSLTSID